jgi:hypothetical protein
VPRTLASRRSVPSVGRCSPASSLATPGCFMPSSRPRAACDSPCSAR